MDLYTDPFVYLCIGSFILNVVTFYLYKVAGARALELEAMLVTCKQQQTQQQASLELTDFLHDQSRYGYSFVRVDPRAVMLRSPRDL